MNGEWKIIYLSEEKENFMVLYYKTDDVKILADEKRDVIPTTSFHSIMRLKVRSIHRQIFIN